MQSEAITAFFALWSAQDAETRLAGLNALLSAEFAYTDPQTPAAITSAADMNSFLAAFTGNMPDAEAQVVEPVDLKLNLGRATVRFFRGSEPFATGQYFFQLTDDARLTRVAGFMGKGPE